MAEDRRSERLTEKDWAWFDRNRLKYLNEDDKGYYAGEFGSLLVRARDDLAALTRELEEAKAERIEANNQWRLDYNEMAGNAELFQEDVISILRHYAPRRSLLDLSGQRIADFLCRYAPALAAEHDLSRAQPGQDETPK